jgi:putative copper resistance protein D
VWPQATHDSTTAFAILSGVLAAGAILASLLRPEIGRYVTEAVSMVCALGAGGVALFVAIAPADLDVPRLVRVPTTWLAIVAFAAALLTLPFAVMVVSGDGLRGLGDGLARAVALRSDDYESVVARGFGLVLVVGALRARVSSRPALVAGAVLISGSYLLTGHARSHHPAAAVVVTDLVHVLAASAWFGGLLALGLALHRSRGDDVVSGRLLAGFARTMTVVLSLLLAAGVGLTVLYLPSPAALVRTVYGDVLLVKLAVIATILVLSTANHLRLVPAAARGSASAVRVLRANIAAEQILLVSVLIITAVLMRQNPGG